MINMALRQINQTDSILLGQFKMKINEKLELLRKEMSKYHIDAYVVPTNDFHGSEYIGDYFKVREFISGFTGSAGTVVITMSEAVLWTDGRYFLQVEEQLKQSEFILMKMGEPKTPTVKEYLNKKMRRGSVIGFDGRTMIASEAEDISSISKLKINSKLDFIGEIWSDRPPISCEPVWMLPEEYSGQSYTDKVCNIRKELKKNSADVLVITSLDEIAWTLNLRGNDVKCNPVFMAFMVITENDSILFTQEKAFNKEIKEKLKKDGVVLKAYHEVYQYLEGIHHKTVWFNKESANYNILNSMNESNKILNQFTPPLLMKSIKNSTEIKNMERAHLLDGIAMTKFIFWLKKNVGKMKLTEISLGEKLEAFRGMAESYLGPSFEPIVGYAKHGAIVHYRATPQTDSEIKDENIVLIDSGGQYLEGTTDITRTISLGKVTDKMKEMYTAVLRGNLSLASAVFREGCSGVALDYLARKPLWEKGMDYNHGTGHGVGYLLNVHESPNAFRYRILPNPQLNPELRPGMITSDEPGVYLEGEFGIRLENLIVCVKKKSTEYGKFLGFRPLTLVPFDKELINISDMTKEEQRLLKQYHKMVYKKVSPYLTEEECIWLREVTG